MRTKSLWTCLLLIPVIAPHSAIAEGLATPVLSLHQRSASQTRALDLSAPRLEFGAVVSLSPKLVGTGAAASYQIAASADGSRGVWADLGLLRYDQETDLFGGLSTNLPLGGKTLQAKTRIGAGYLLRAGTPFVYTRAVVTW